jgi:hypothetical protein
MSTIYLPSLQILVIELVPLRLTWLAYSFTVPLNCARRRFPQPHCNSRDQFCGEKTLAALVADARGDLRGVQLARDRTNLCAINLDRSPGGCRSCPIQGISTPPPSQGSFAPPFLPRFPLILTYLAAVRGRICRTYSVGQKN